MSEASTDLALVERFLNTLDERTFSVHGEKHEPGDRLTSPEALTAWLRAEGLPAPADLAATVALRDALRQALLGGSAPELGSFPLRLAPDDSGRLRLTGGSGVPAVDAIIETVATSVAGGGWNRLKLCASDDCHWAFYDTSRSGGGRWCSMDVCGNRHKTRAYRRRQVD